jgi:hypothetical protein
VQPQIVGSGIPAPDCVTYLRNALYYWDGARFCRLVTGSFEPENLSTTIPYTSGQVALGNATRMRAQGGNFLYATNSNIINGVQPAQELLTDVVMFVCDVPGGSVTLVYDDDATGFIGEYAWMKWNNFTPSCALIKFGNGPTTSGSPATDPQRLFVVPSVSFGAFTVAQFGADAGIDQPSTTDISWYIQSGFSGLNTPSLTKWLHRLLLSLEATPGVGLYADVFTSGYQNGSVITIQSAERIYFENTAAIGGAGTSNVSQVTIASFQPALIGYSFLIKLQYAPTPGASNEFGMIVTGITADYIENAFTP